MTASAPVPEDDARLPRAAARGPTTKLGNPASRTLRPPRPNALARSPRKPVTEAAISFARMRVSWPAVVSTIPREVRSKSLTPRSFSSAFMCWVSAGCDQPSSRAAAPMLPASAIAPKISRRFGSPTSRACSNTFDISPGYVMSRGNWVYREFRVRSRDWMVTTS